MVGPALRQIERHPLQHPDFRPGPAARLGRTLLFLCLGVLIACAPAPRSPVPEDLVTRAEVPGYAGIRYWGDESASIGEEEAITRARQLEADNNTVHREFLALSGGGSSGAFGAGILVGWTQSGTRPEFETVTGVSTGSLSAPFAFLGPPWDARLRDSYTQVSGDEIYRMRSIFGILGQASAADNTPLRRLVESYVTDEMVAAIAKEQLRGRRLFVLTTNLDAGRPVVWNLGAIAGSDQPGRKQLIQTNLVASAAIPGVFPPVRIKVTVDGVTYDEMHVDGSTSKSAFFVPRDYAEKVGKTGGRIESVKNAFYVIRNGRVDPDYQATKPGLAAIMGRSVNTVLFYAAIDNLYELYATAQSLGFRFNAVWVPASFTMKEPRPFDADFMRALYTVGYEIGLKGDFWEDYPPR